MWQDIIAITLVVAAVAFWLLRMLKPSNGGCGSCSASKEPTRPDAYGTRHQLVDLNLPSQQSNRSADKAESA